MNSSISDTGAIGGAAPQGFDAIALRQFVSPQTGLVLQAPAHWEDTSDSTCFQVSDSQTGTQFSATAYQNPGMTLEAWAQTRLSAVAEMLPSLYQHERPYPVEGRGWRGVAAEYGGQFPDSEEDVRYLVLCIATDSALVSATVVAPTAAFFDQRPFIDWLLRNRLELYQVRSAESSPEGLAAAQTAAAAGNPEAQFALGRIYETGEQVGQDLAAAAMWYERAAAGGHAHAQYNLGAFRANGQGGFQDYAAAATLWRQAADQGLADAQFALGMLYHHGAGVERDSDMAVHLWKMAAVQGHEEARKLVA